jgi:hypothetical protein
LSPVRPLPPPAAIFVLTSTPPPFHTGIIILLIGASLIGTSSAPNCAGGSNSCSDRNPHRHLRPLSHHLHPSASPMAVHPSSVTIVLTELFSSPFLMDMSNIAGLAAVTALLESSSAPSPRIQLEIRHRGCEPVQVVWKHCQRQDVCRGCQSGNAPREPGGLTFIYSCSA